MIGRDFSSANYRYGFNGKEKDKETVNGSTYDYGFRIYNSSLGKFLSVDPLYKKFPWYTPYQFAGNKPIWAIDLDGLEEIYYFVGQAEKNAGFKNAMEVLRATGILAEIKKEFGTGNTKTDAYLNITPTGTQNSDGDTKVYLTYKNEVGSSADNNISGKRMSQQNIVNDNPNIPQQPIIKNTILKR